ncbi:MAG: thioredoxin [Erysipelotrichaceae bacterium]
MPVLKISDAEFQKTLQENEVVLVDFYADWCGPCKMIGPVLEELAKDGHTIAKINVDTDTQTPKSFGVTSIPTLIVFKNGEQVKQHIGFAAKAQLEELLKV